MGGSVPAPLHKTIFDREPRSKPLRLIHVDLSLCLRDARDLLNCSVPAVIEVGVAFPTGANLIQRNGTRSTPLNIGDACNFAELQELLRRAGPEEVDYAGD